MSNPAQEHERLVQLLQTANYQYFNGLSEVVSEPVRDQLKQQLIALETAHPELITEASPTQRVGAPLDSRLDKAVHKTKKWSLSDAFEPKDITDWLKRIKKELDQEHVEISIEVKIDGVNATLWYENGELVKALTRGNGTLGEDITHAVRTIRSIPLRLSKPNTVELTGEIYIATNDFEAIEHGTFANARNLAAGTIRLLDPKTVQERKLKMRIYSLGENDLSSPPKNQSALFTWLENAQIPHIKPVWLGTDEATLLQFCHDFQTKKDDFPFAIDGLVLKVHNRLMRQQLGHTAKVERGSLAWKFPAKETITTLKGVEWQVGRTGVLTPVAHLEPVFLEGSTVQRAILHNWVEIQKKDIRINDQVIIIKAGDIIPAVVRPLTEMRNGSEKIIIPPRTCPSCKNPVVADEMRILCKHHNCPAKLIAHITYIGKFLDIDGLGNKTAELLIEHKLVHKIEDLWALTKTDLEVLPGFKTKKINTLLKGLRGVKKAPMYKVLVLLGIPGFGSQVSQITISAFPKLTAIKELIKEISANATEGFTSIQERLNGVKGLGDVLIQSFSEALADPDIQASITALDKLGIGHKQMMNAGALANQKYAITGTFPIPRKTIKAYIEEQNGTISSTVNADLTALICGEAAGSKKEKAIKNGLKILYWQDIQTWFENETPKEEPANTLF